MSLVKSERRLKIKRRVAGKITASAERPRLVVFRSNAEIYAQIVDINHKTVCASSSREKDLVASKETNTAKEYEEHIKERTAPFTDYPVVFISALNKQRIFQAIETAAIVYDNLSNKIKTSVLNDLLLPIVKATPPPSIKGKTVSIKYIQQLPSKSVCFAFFCNLPQYISESYKRFLENQLRDRFNFNGVPIKIFFRKK